MAIEMFDFLLLQVNDWCKSHYMLIVNYTMVLRHPSHGFRCSSLQINSLPFINLLCHKILSQISPRCPLINKEAFNYEIKKELVIKIPQNVI